MTAPMVEKTIPVKSRRRNVSRKTKGAIKALHKIATVPNGATIDAGANPSTTHQFLPPQMQTVPNPHPRTPTESGAEGPKEGGRGGSRTCDKIARLANGHEHQPRPPKLAPQIHNLVLLLLIIAALGRVGSPVRCRGGFGEGPLERLSASLDSFVGQPLDVEGKRDDDVAREADDDADERCPARSRGRVA